MQFFVRHFSSRFSALICIFLFLSSVPSPSFAETQIVGNASLETKSFLSWSLSRLSSFLTVRPISSESLFIMNSTPRSVSSVGGQLSLFSYKGLTLKEVLQNALSNNNFPFTTLISKGGKYETQVQNMLLTTLTPLNGYNLFATNSQNLFAQSVDSSNNKTTLPTLDRLSLALFCGLSSWSANLDQKRCDYNTIADGKVLPVTFATAESDPQVVTSTQQNTVMQPAPIRSSSVETVPKYITQYITKYFTVEGTPGKDGMPGANGRDGRDAKDSQGGFGGYVYPSFSAPTQSLVGVSTIGYLNNATIDSSIFNYGTSTSMYLRNANINFSTFNGANVFNDLVTFTGSALVNNLNATSSTFLNATTTNAYVSSFAAATSSLIDTFLTNATTTNAYISSLVALNATTTNSFISSLDVATGTFTNASLTNASTTNLTVLNATTTNSTTTNAFIQNLTVGSSTTGSMTINGTIAVTGTSTLATTTATSLSVGGAVFASSTLAVTGQSTFYDTLNLLADMLPATDIARSLGSNTFRFLNLFAQNIFATSSIITNASSTNFFSTNADLDNVSSTNFSATNSTTTNATTTNLFTQNLAVGNGQTQGNQSINGTLTVDGTVTLGSNVFLNSNVVVGTSSSNMFTVNALINSNISPAQNKVYDLGSPSFYWRNLYTDNINVNSISAASTTISGTSNNDFTLNSDNASPDGEDMSLIFSRGPVIPNAILRWNSSNKRFETNQSLKVENETPTTGTTTLTIKAGAGQGVTNLLEIVNNSASKLSVFNAAGWLGIGSTTPSSALTVIGNGYFGGNMTATGTLGVIGVSTLATTTASQLTTSGSVGVGTNSPLGKLQVEGGSIYANAPQSDSVINGGVGNAWQTYANLVGSAGLWAIRTAVNGSINFDTNNNSSPISALTISTGGNVGIGTSSPSSKFQVAGDATLGVVGSIAGNLIFNNASNLFTTTLRASSTQASNLTFTLPGTTGSANQALLTDGSGGMFWGAAGVSGGQNGYIPRWLSASTQGTSTLLDNGTVAGVNATSSLYSFNVQGVAGVSPFNVASSSGSSFFTILGNGNIGIGTSNPASRLSILDAGNTAAGQQIRLGNVAGVSDYTIGRNITTGFLDLSGSQTGFVGYTFSGGNVGIGTTTPSTLLHLASGTNASGGLLIESTSGSAGGIADIELRGKRDDTNGSAPFGGSLYLSRLYTSGNMVQGANDTFSQLGNISFGGNAGGTSTSNIVYPASIGGIVEGAFTNASTANTGLVFRTGSVGQVKDAVNAQFGTERLRITSGGNVGIGTSTPQARLTVQGTSTGRVSIGTWTDPTYGALSLNGTWGGAADYNFLSGVSDSNLYINRPSGKDIYFAEQGISGQLTLKSGGNVGIGTANPGSKLTVAATLTDTSGFIFGTNTGVTVNPSSASTASFFGNLTSITSAGSNISASNGIYGSFSDAVHGTSATIAAVTGLYNRIQNNSTGTIANGRALEVTTLNNSTGVISNAAGVYINTPGNGSGTLTNTYGLYINSQTAGTQTNAPFAIYQAGASDKNYFAGRVGIGTTTPGSLLSVQGSAYIGGSVTATGTLGVTGQTTLTTASSSALTATNLYSSTASLGNATSTNFFSNALSATNAIIDSLTTRLTTLTSLVVGTAQTAAQATSNALLSLNLTTTGTELVTKNTTEGFSVSGSTNTTGVSTSSNQISLLLASTTVIGGGVFAAGPNLSSGTVTNGANALQRPDGKYLVINGGGVATTNIYDPVANTFAIGPSLNTGTANFGSFSIQRPDGKFLVVNGGGTGTTNLYDPIANTFVAGPTFSTGAADYGSHAVLRSDGKFLIVNGGGVATTNIYDPVANTFSSGPSLASGSAYQGAHSIQRPDGKFLLVNGNSSSLTNIYDPIANTFITGPSLSPGTANYGSHSFQRSDGTFVIVVGGAASITKIYDPVANTVSPGSLLTANAQNGSHSIQRPDGRFLTFMGNTTATTNIYDPVTNTFTLGPSLASGTASNGSLSLQRPDGKYLVINGGGTATTNLYDPSYIMTGSYESEDINVTDLNQSSVLNFRTNGEGLIEVAIKTATSSTALSYSTTVYATTTSGSKIFPVNGATYAKVKVTMTRPVVTNRQPYPGAKENKTWLGESDTKYQRVFANPVLYTFSISNQKGYHVTNTDFGTTNATSSLGVNATSSGPLINNLLTGDAGLTLPYTMGVTGQSTLVDEKGVFTAGPSLNAGTCAAGCHSIQRPDGKVLIINGGATTTTNLFDPNTKTFLLGPTLTTSAGAGSHSYQRPDGKFLVFVGGGSAVTNIYDPIANTFVAGPSVATGNIGVGASSIQLPNGKFLTANGGTTTSTNIYDPISNIFTTGPTVASATNVGTGSFFIQRPDGRFLFAHGGTAANFDLYDPVTNTFTASSGFTAVEAGGFAFQRQDGRWTIAPGGSSATTCVYDGVGGTGGCVSNNSLPTSAGAHSIQRPDGKIVTIQGVTQGTATILYTPHAAPGAYVPAGDVYGTGPTLTTTPGDGAHSIQLPDGKYLTLIGGGSAVTNIYDSGWVTRGYYESEFINDTTLDSNSVLTWKGNADAYKSGVVSVRVRTATSSDAIASSTWKTLPVSGSRINPGTNEVWLQVHIDMNRTIANGYGAGKAAYSSSYPMYNRQTFFGDAGYNNQAGVFVKPVIYSYSIQKQEGQDFATFQVNGNSAFRFSATGDAYTSAGGSWNAGGADVAEYFPVAQDSLLEPGDVVSVSKNADGLADMSTSAYDEKLLGIVTTAPGVLLGNDDAATLQYKRPIALAGRVPVKISLENGIIHKGDYLTSSSKPGYAMKALTAGRVVGIALADYTLEDDTANNGAGKVLVMVNPSFYAGASFTNKVGSIFSGLAISVRKAISEFGITITDTGSIGVGIADPLSRFHVAGDIRTGVASSTAGRLVFQNDINGYITTLQSATGTLSSDLTFTLPATLGSSSQALITDGTGILHFGNVALLATSTTSLAGLSARFMSDHELTSGVLMDNGVVSGVNATSSVFTFTVQGSTTTDPLNVANAQGSSLLAVLASGNVSIGVASSSSRLGIFDPTHTATTDILRISSNVGSENNLVLHIDAGGNIFSEGGISTAIASGISEAYAAEEALDAGTVVAFSTSTTPWSVTTGSATTTSTSTDIYDVPSLRKASTAYEAVGVVSTNAGLNLASGTAHGVPVVFVGRVPVHVTAENGEVKQGDYLTVSATIPGYAMKLTGTGHAIGIALSSYIQGRDKVLMLVDNSNQTLNLEGKQATTTAMLTTGNIDLDANGVAIINIKSLASANGAWSIDEAGRIVARVLCLEDVCIDKGTLTNILNSTGQRSLNSESAPSGSAAGSATTTSDDVSTSTIESAVGTSTETISTSSDSGTSTAPLSSSEGASTGDGSIDEGTPVDQDPVAILPATGEGESTPTP